MARRRRNLIDARKSCNGTWLLNMQRPYCAIASKSMHRATAVGNAEQMREVARGLEWLDKHAPVTELFIQDEWVDFTDMTRNAQDS